MRVLPKGSALPGFNKPFHGLIDEPEALASDLPCVNCLSKQRSGLATVAACGQVSGTTPPGAPSSIPIRDLEAGRRELVCGGQEEATDNLRSQQAPNHPEP